MPDGVGPGELAYTKGRSPLHPEAASVVQLGPGTAPTPAMSASRQLHGHTAALARDSGSLKAIDRTRFRRATDATWAGEEGTRQMAGSAAGGKGARGELTRRPGEAGSPYGVSVFVDEYAQWGRKLPAAGMTHGKAIERQDDPVLLNTQ
jgi:hypothetical protein